MPKLGNLCIFTGNANVGLARDIVEVLGMGLGDIDVTRFSDDETRVRINESVRGKDVFIIQPTCPPVNDHLMELLIMIDAFKRASVKRITAVIPYYGYARQEKKLKPREPISAKLVADLIAVAGANRILTMDLHVQSIQGFFNQPVDHVPAGPIIADYLLEKGLKGEGVVVVSPDPGGVGRAKALADRLDASLGIIAKRRPEPNIAEVFEVVGHVKGRTAILFDDIVDTGGSLVQGAGALRRRGAAEIYACATHAILSGSAVELIDGSEIKNLIVTNTVPVRAEKRSSKITVLSVAPVLADAIKRVHQESSVSTLFERYWSES